jgi:feruloyl esterase
LIDTKLDRIILDQNFSTTRKTMNRSSLHNSRHACFFAAIFALAVVLFGQIPSAFAATACEDLARLALPNAKIDAATMVPAGTFVPPGARGATTVYAKLPAFCRVTATLAPSSDSDIKTEIWLPATGWNGKFQAVGNGGWAGTIPYAAIAAAVTAGYAGAGTDTGHTGGNADFALGHPEKLVDFAHRSIHEMTVQAKSIIDSHYGTPAKLSYYNGCSTGGRQGLAAAQKYPGDFDGIIAGASAWNQMRAHGARVALNIIVNKDADSVIPASKYSMIHDAVLQACDASDGVRDGVIENPQMCKFDYKQLACKAEDGANCLTKGQIESAKAMTSVLKDPNTGRVLFEGHLMPGSELGWATLAGAQPLALSTSGMRNVVFRDRTWDYHTMNLSTDVDRAANSDDGVLYSGDPNLKPFFDRGGKLLMYHGWTDQQVNPLNSVIYYTNVLDTVGKDKGANSIALFMVPGMNHCAGGAGTDTFDKVKTLEDWVEQGKTPTRIIASHSTNGQVDKTRPLCAYPQVAKYKGTGDTNDAANFVCGR